jgi:hypothetical protein
MMRVSAGIVRALTTFDRLSESRQSFRNRQGPDNRRREGVRCGPPPARCVVTATWDRAVGRGVIAVESIRCDLECAEPVKSSV